MKSNAPQNFIATTCSITDYRENGHVAEEAVGIIRRPEVAAAGPADTWETDNVQITSGNSRKEIYLDGDLAKRKYEDMTSSRVESVEAANDHEVSTKLSYFREHKKRRPPETNDLMRDRETTTVQGERVSGEDKLQARTSESARRSRRSRSASRVEITPEICGESDLTAETHMADESSRSSNNDGSSMFESAGESASKGSNREFRSVTSLGVMHSFLNRTKGAGDVSTLLISSEEPSHVNKSLVKNDVHSSTRTAMADVKDWEGVSKSEPMANHQVRSGSTQAPPSVLTSTVPSQLWGRSNQDSWLQLGVGANSPVQAEKASGVGGKPSSFSHGSEERAPFKRKITTSVEFPISSDCEAHSSSFPGNSIATTGDRQFRRGSNVIPPKCEGSSDPSINLNPATFVSVPISSLMSNAASPDVADIGKPDLCIFGRRLIQTGTARQELVLAPLSSSGARQSSSNASEKDRGMTRLDSSFELRKDQEEFQGFMISNRDEIFHNAGFRTSEIHNRAGPSVSPTSTPITDLQFRSVQARSEVATVDQETFQCSRDNTPCALSTLQQRKEDLRHGQVGYSWLPPPTADRAPKLIPKASNFQGWTSSELASTTKLAALSGSSNAVVDIPQEQQAMRGSDEWGSLFRKVSPKMLFQSQCQLPEGSSVLVQSAGHDTNVGSQENLVALKRAIENIQKRPQWPIPPEAMNFSVASWCFNGNPEASRSDSKLESFGGDRPLMSPIISESGPVHSRFAGDQLNLSEKPQQRQSWQPVTGHTKLHHGNVNALHKHSPETVGKAKQQVLPPASRGTNHAGLWFILQSAENQSCEGGLPQISKSYLRIKDGKMPVSAVKKYLVSKLGLTSESEVEITCKGQPVVPSLPLQHVRDVIWFSSLNANNNNKEQTSSGEREEFTGTSEQRSRPPNTADRAAAAAGMFSKDILMVLTYRRHPRTLQLSTLLT